MNIPSNNYFNRTGPTPAPNTGLEPTQPASPVVQTVPIQEAAPLPEPVELDPGAPDFRATANSQAELQRQASSAQARMRGVPHARRSKDIPDRHPPATLQELLLRHPEFHTHQDLINYAFKRTQNVDEAAALLQEYGLHFSDLVNNRGGEVAASPSAGTMLQGALGANTLQKDLHLGAHNDTVTALQSALRSLKHNLNVDGIYGQETAKNVRQYMREKGQHGSGKAVNEALARKLVVDVDGQKSDHMDGLMQSLTQEMLQKDPATVAKMHAQLATIHKLPNDQEKTAALTQGFKDLDARMKELGDTLSPQARRDWQELSTQVRQDIANGMVLQRGRAEKAAFNDYSKAAFQDAISNLTQELQKKDPKELETIQSEVARIKEIPEGLEKDQAIKAGYARLDRHISFMANKDLLSPEALKSWEEFKANADEGLKDPSTLLPLARLADSSMLETLKAQLAHDVEVNGENPAEVSLSEATKGTLETLESQAAGKDNQAINYRVLQKVCPKLSTAQAQEITPHINRSMNDAGIVTAKERAAYLANIAHESANFTRYSEMYNVKRDKNGNSDHGQAYFTHMYDITSDSAHQRDKARELGNTQPGDGAKYAGHGAIQITGKANHSGASLRLFNDLRFVDNPLLMTQVKYAFDVSGDFWSHKNLNALADKDAIKMLTRRISGSATQGYDDRLQKYGGFLQALGNA